LASQLPRSRGTLYAMPPQMHKNFRKDNTFISDFEKLTEIGIDLSQQFKGIYAPTRRLGYSTRTLAKIIDNCVSILRLMPGSIFFDDEDAYLDFPSVASLCRDLIEACNYNWYLSIERISKSETDLRLEVNDFHDFFELMQMAKLLTLNKTDFEYLQGRIEEHRVNIESSEIFNNLDKQKKSLILKGKQGMILTQFEIAERRKLNLDKFKGIYKLLSNQTHSSANSIKMLTYSRLYDEENILQEALTAIIVEYCNRFLASTILNVGRIWKIEFAKPESEELVKRYARRIKNK